MAVILTSHLGVGKLIELKSNTLFLNTTVKSSSGLLECAFAPTWDMVKLVKNVDKNVHNAYEVYSKLYLDNIKMTVSNAQIKEILNLLSADKTHYEYIVVACYDGSNKFCHRHLLSRFLVEHFNFTLGYEINNQSIEVIGKKDNRTVYGFKNNLENLDHGAMMDTFYNFGV